MKYRILKPFFCIHLLITLWCSGLFTFKNSTVDQGMLTYGSWTGSAFGYSFFSPDVGTETVARVYTVLPDNELKTDAFGQADNIFDTRLVTLMNAYGNNKSYELLSRTLVSYIFSKYPTATKTYISIGKYMPCAMKEYPTNKTAGAFKEIVNGLYIRQ